MDKLEIMMQKYFQYILFILAAEVMGWAISDQKIIFQGLILGTIVGLFNLWFMARKTIRFGKAAAEGRRPKSIGTFTRMGTAVLAVLVAIEYPQYFSILPVVLGLITIYFVIVIDFALRLRKDSQMKER